PQGFRAPSRARLHSGAATDQSESGPSRFRPRWRWRGMSLHTEMTDAGHAPGTRFHVIGAGPVGLIMTALLQPTPGPSARLYEKRAAYTRTRMVKLASYLVADSLESYRADHIDGETVEAVFDPAELAEGLALRKAIPGDLMALLKGWTRGFCPLNRIE